MMPIILGVDVARFGDDRTVIVARQGRKIIDIRVYSELNTMQVATRVVEAIREYHPVATFVDGIGIGAGVVDRLHQLNFEVFEVIASSKADDEVTYYNKRVEMWDRMRQWLGGGADIPLHNNDLRTDLIGIEYGFNDKEQMRLERKQDMKKRGLDSPDIAEAVAVTFAEFVGDGNMNAFEPEDNFEPGDDGTAQAA